jgi:hypothetical protein
MATKKNLPPLHQQAKQYDKIVRENIEAVIPGLMRKILHIEVATAEEIPDDLQHTKERAPDLLKKITDIHGAVFILHLEFQVAPDADMPYRMAEYAIMLARKYRLDIRQYVIFMGNDATQMPTHLRFGRLQYHYPLIVLHKVSYRQFLEQAATPEEAIFALLANFEDTPPETVVRSIIEHIDETTTGGLALEKRVNQLRILSKLRNLAPVIEKVMDSIEKLYTIESDPFYLIGDKKGVARGISQGISQKEREVVENLLRITTIQPAEIARIAGTTVEYVLAVQAEIAKHK